MKTPFILVDNVFDRINLYPNALISYTDVAMVGREIQYIADYRRERTFFQGASPVVTSQIIVELAAGQFVAPDTIWFDRGHNLWGKEVVVEGGNDPLTSWFDPTLLNRIVPAQGTVGGDPTTGWCVTEEGAIYAMTTNVAARRRWRIYVTGAAFQPLITGVILGKRTQLLGYSSVVDEDAGERSERSEQSLIPGYAGTDRTYSARKLELKLSLIGAAEYDSNIRMLRRVLFDINQPFVCVTNYGIKPERGWLYKVQGNQWSSPLTRTFRSLTLTAFEYGPLIR